LVDDTKLKDCLMQVVHFRSFSTAYTQGIGQFTQDCIKFLARANGPTMFLPVILQLDKLKTKQIEK